MTRLIPVALVAAAAAALAIGCGDSDSDDVKASGSANAESTADTAVEDVAATKAKPKGKVVKVVDSRYGRVIADARGEAYYLFDREDTKRSECYGACATAWPPVLTKGKPRAGKGTRQGLLATTKRRGGKRQVTYDGHPLYYYVDDTPGNILCHDVEEFGGLWLVVKPNGEPVS